MPTLTLNSGGHQVFAERSRVLYSEEDVWEVVADTRFLGPVPVFSSPELPDAERVHDAIRKASPEDTLDMHALDL